LLGVTATVNLAVRTFRAESDARQRTVVVPTGNVAPGAGAQVTGTAPDTASRPRGIAYRTTAPAVDDAGTVIPAGTPVMTGAIVSRTVTLNDATVSFPSSSRATQRTSVVPSGNVDAGLGAHESDATLPPESSAVTSYETVAPDALVASTTRSPGVWITGARPSTTVTVNSVVDVL
jgi:hypothetical protein